MNREAQEKLASLLALEPEALSEADRAFLAARRDYLTEEQQIRYNLVEGQNQNSKPDYGKLKKAELQEALKARGIVFDESFKNAVLVEMLNISDAGMTPHIVSEEDLENNPELKERGIVAGSVIGLPTEENQQ